jgi:hypothetical protein
MRRLLLATTALLALAAATPAAADIILETKLSGTGDNVVFTGITADLALARLNGQHNEVVRFRDLTGSTTFTAAGTNSSNGNDIKIAGSNNLFIQVFDAANQNLIGTTTEVFSLNGTGNLSIFVQATDANGNAEAIKTFTGYTLDPNKPSNFTLSAINGEVITSVRLLDLQGGISAFEHFRIDTAPIPTAAVPELSTWFMMILGFAGVGLAAMRKSAGRFRFA